MKNFYEMTHLKGFAELIAESLTIKNKIKIREVRFDTRYMAYELKVEFECGLQAKYFISDGAFHKLFEEIRNTVPVMLTPGYSYVPRATAEKFDLEILKKINNAGRIIEKQETWRDRPPLL